MVTEGVLAMKKERLANVPPGVWKRYPSQILYKPMFFQRRHGNVNNYNGFGVAFFKVQ